jgi:hypothetical protein
MYVLTEYLSLFPIATESILKRGDRTTNPIENSFKDRNLVLEGKVYNLFEYIEKRAVHMTNSCKAQLSKLLTPNPQRRRSSSDAQSSAAKRIATVLQRRESEEDTQRQQLLTKFGYAGTSVSNIQKTAKPDTGDPYSKKALTDDERQLCRYLKVYYGHHKTQGSCTSISGLISIFRNAVVADNISSVTFNATTIGRMLREEGCMKDKATFKWLHAFLYKKLSELDALALAPSEDSTAGDSSSAPPSVAPPVIQLPMDAIPGLSLQDVATTIVREAPLEGEAVLDTSQRKDDCVIS